MAEPPIHVEPDGVKPELRRTGHRWIDLTIAVSAIVLSLISLAVAIGNARTQEKMVAATTWPLLHYGTTNTDDGELVISMTVANTGVGPALVKTIQLAYGGRPIRSPEELLIACCGWTPDVKARVEKEDKRGLLSSRVSGTVMRPGDEVSFIVIPRTEANAVVWERLNRARFEIELDACYCSVFQECWRSDLDSLEPERVDRCEAVPVPYR